MKDNKFHIKHIELYIIGFVLAVATASVAFVYACNNSAKLEPGWYQIGTEDNAEVKAYGSDFTFMAYFDGKSSEISASRNNYKTYYSSTLATYYAFLDDVNVYNSFPSIGLLNDHKNEVVTLSEFGYNTLHDAYLKTKNNQNYSVFAGPLYGFWSNQFNLTPNLQIENDPLNNESNRLYLESLAGYINDPNHIDLEFLENNQVRLNVSSEYLSFIDANEISYSLVSLNILRTSYLLDAVSTEMNNKNLDKGLIYTSDGILSVLKNSPDQNYAVNTINKDEGLKVATITASKPSSYSSFRSFKLNNELLPSHYVISKDDVTYYRSYYININNGIPNNSVFSSSIYSTSFNLATSSYINNKIMSCSNIENIRDFINANHYENVMLAVSLNDNSKNLYINESLKNYISLSTELDYNLINI